VRNAIEENDIETCLWKKISILISAEGSTAGEDPSLPDALKTVATSFVQFSTRD
jgi:hypothetical protein